MLVIFGFKYKKEHKRQSNEHKNARNRDGEKPANQTKINTEKNEK